MVFSLNSNAKAPILDERMLQVPPEKEAKLTHFPEGSFVGPQQEPFIPSARSGPGLDPGARFK
ncbi:hypothetical protein IPV27_24330 [Acidovorax sp. SD340]|uniref:Uncharacterized protein n=1 Tax=Acidovorax facilis TaxID=12917 RepID=A0ABV8DAX9_9BURK|nr:hypothetical protein [Acidovorax sp. SD340]MBO1010788.1 hypothetical protein [Acidovorax sp. SD340]